MTDEAKKVIENLNRCSINDSDTVIDAIDLIERLSAENEALRNNLTQRKDCKNCAHSGCGKYRCKLDQTIYGTDYVCRMFVRGDSADMIERLAEELEQVKRERDAAVYDIEHYADCDACKAAYEEIGCPMPCKLVWRSVCAENSGGDADAEN